MTAQPPPTAKLAAARELIIAKQYVAARTVLEAIPDDPTARQWLAKLATLAPVQPPTVLPVAISHPPFPAEVPVAVAPKSAPIPKPNAVAIPNTTSPAKPLPILSLVLFGAVIFVIGSIIGAVAVSSRPHSDTSIQLTLVVAATQLAQTINTETAIAPTAIVLAPTLPPTATADICNTVRDNIFKSNWNINAEKPTHTEEDQIDNWLNNCTVNSVYLSASEFLFQVTVQKYGAAYTTAATTAANAVGGALGTGYAEASGKKTAEDITEALTRYFRTGPNMQIFIKTLDTANQFGIGNPLENMLAAAEYQAPPGN